MVYKTASKHLDDHLACSSHCFPKEMDVDMDQEGVASLKTPLSIKMQSEMIS